MEETKNILTITEITRQIKHSLENRFPRISLQGELSNFKRHTSGHLYFTLKDESSQISAAMWRSRTGGLSFTPEDGMKVVVTGAITVYPPRGSYQIDVERMQPFGVGELQLAFERLKRKLAEEGLFDEGRKRPIPEYPACVGLVTSESGAALQDIRSVLERRMPMLEVLLVPVRVQGAGAAQEIARAIGLLNRTPGVDVMIVGRGGGSLEDLWAFNEEIVARAIAASNIPVISAVGHEIDFTIADFVADLRAPTPSAAAELVTPDRADLLAVVRNLRYTIREHVTGLLEQSRTRVEGLVGSYSFNRPRDLVREHRQHIDELERSLRVHLEHGMEIASHQAGTAALRLEALSPEGVLKRGYAIVKKHGTIVSTASGFEVGDEAAIQFHDGTVVSTVQSAS